MLDFTHFDPINILITFLVLSLSLSIHEAAHAYAAFRMGDDTAALSGRLTLNPFRHLDFLGSLMFLFVGIGWAKPVPINPSRFDRAKSTRQGIVYTSLWGPLSNLLLAAVSWLLFCIIYTIALATSSLANDIVLVLLRLMTALYSANIWLCIFNLLPIPPLDGYKIFGALLPPDTYYRIMQRERIIGIVFIAILIFFRPVVSRVLYSILIPFDFVIRKPIVWIFQKIQIAAGLPPMMY